MQLAVGPVPLRVQLGGTNALFLLVLLLVQVTVPVGVSGKPRDVSDIEAVHELARMAGTIHTVGRGMLCYSQIEAASGGKMGRVGTVGPRDSMSSV